MTSANNQDQKPESINYHRLALSLLAMPLFFVVFMFLPAGSWIWMRGWLLILVFLASGALSFLYIWRMNPEVLAARINPHKGTKRWDTILFYFFVPTTLAIFPVAALDDERFHWFHTPWWVSIVGCALLLLGMVILSWAQAVNKFFEPTVRIQTDRGQKVIDTGPYGIVRHPGYLAWLVMSVGIALCLGSLWALIPAGLSTLLLILRTQWEDQTLQSELIGYKKYTEKVRYRLLPGVW
ncbi:MAG: isoprenylcysteine carboxylmethyltransferase family protein [Planctomycetes bacterium]|nr:isoprenylcysteine carboxylmethyltransferase family protein [Planctomycetota bacterium]